MRLKLLLLPLLAATLCGCPTIEVDHDFKAPVSDKGKQCVAECGWVREECRRNDNERVLAEKRACERDVERDFRACMSVSKNKDQDKKCLEKRDRTSCTVTDRLDRCESEYKQCFTHCGGVITKTVERSDTLNDAIATPEQVERVRKATRAAMAVQGFRQVPCSSKLATIYCDDFSDSRSSVSIWIARDDPKTVHMSYAAVETPDDPSSKLFKAVLSAIEPSQN